MPKLPDIAAKFLIKGFERVGGEADQLDGHRFLHTNYNFFGLPPCPIQDPYSSGGHHPSTSRDTLGSSEAFARNIFSGVKNVKLEYAVPVDIRFMEDAEQEPFPDIGWSPKYVITDVVIDDGNGVIDIYEVKMFEFVSKIGGMLFKPKVCYDDNLRKIKLKGYYSTEKVTECFRKFIQEVSEYSFVDEVYYEGISQLCYQLLGIINEMKKYDTMRENMRGKYIEPIDWEKYNTLYGKKVRWHCLCFDHDFGWEAHINALNKYKKALKEMTPMVKKFLKNVNLDKKIEYCGYLGAKEYIEENKKLLGKKNYEYVKKRYFYDRKYMLS
jgi:hypothetical protein